MSSLDKNIKSQRFLISKRYTHSDNIDGQEAFTNVLDLNANEIYIDHAQIPSTNLPFSASIHSGSFYSASIGTAPIMKYYYKHKMTVSSKDTSVWFVLDPTGSSVGTDPQLLDSNQLTNFISPKYSVSGLSTKNAEDTPAGYNVKVFITGSNANPAGLSDANILADTLYSFDYKTGVLEYVATAGAGAGNTLYISAYRYVGRTLNNYAADSSSFNTRITTLETGGGGSGAGFPFSGSAIISGSLLISGSGNTFVVSGSTYLPTISQGATTNVITVDPATGRLYYTASSAVGAGSIDTSQFVTNSQTGSFIKNSQTASFITNSQTSSFVTNSQTSSMTVLSSSYASTASFIFGYVPNSQTGSFVSNNQTGSFITNSQTSSMTVLSSSYAATASYALNAGVTINTGSLLVTASVSLNTITFTKGDGSTFPITVNTGSGGGSITLTNSGSAITSIEIADYDTNFASTYTGGNLKFIFGTPTIPSSASLTFNSTFLTDRFNKVLDNYDISASYSLGGYTLVSASLYTGSVLLAQTGSGTTLRFNTTTSGSQNYRLEVTASSPLDGSKYYLSASLSGTLSKSNPGQITISPTPTVQLGVYSSIYIEQGATGSISYTTTTGSLNSWVYVSKTSSPASPISVTGSGSAYIPITATAYYSSSGALGSDNSPVLTTTSTATYNYYKMRSVRYGVSAQSSFSLGELGNLALWDISLGGSIGTIALGTTYPYGYQFTVSPSSQYIYIVIDDAYTLTGILNVANSNSNDLAGAFSYTTIGSYKVYRSNTLKTTTILYELRV